MSLDKHWCEYVCIDCSKFMYTLQHIPIPAAMAHMGHRARASLMIALAWRPWNWNEEPLHRHIRLAGPASSQTTIPAPRGIFDYIHSILLCQLKLCSIVEFEPEMIIEVWRSHISKYFEYSNLIEPPAHVKEIHPPTKRVVGPWSPVSALGSSHQLRAVVVETDRRNWLSRPHVSRLLEKKSLLSK